MDTTAIGIGLGISAAIAYVLCRAVRQRTFDLQHMILVFLGAFSIPGGVQLVAAAYIGNQINLPSSWREHVAVAGITVVGIAAQYLFGAFHNSWPRQATPPSDPGGTRAGAG